MAEKTNNCHILLVEDNPDHADLATMAIRALGPSFTVAVARSLSEAKSYLAGAGVYNDRAQYPPPNMILCDLRLGEDSGNELTSWLRGNRTLQGIPVIIFTASVEAEEIRTAYAAGANSVVTKPTGLAETKRVIGELAGFWCRSPM